MFPNDTQKTMRIFWSFCGYVLISPLWSLCGCMQIRSTHRAEFLRMLANEKLPEILRICAYFSSVEFVWTYAKPLHTQGGVSAYVCE